jgi:anti-sigma factor RsiW
MNHQPFETWLLEPSQLNEQQAAELRAHLAGCPDCARLQVAWQQVAAVIRAEPELPAPAGFTQRWQADLEARKARQRARQVRRALFLLAGGVFLVSLALLGYWIASGPAEFLLRLATTYTDLASTVGGVQQFFQFLLHVAPPAIPFVLGLALAAWVLILSLTWVFAFLRFSSKGETNR